MQLRFYPSVTHLFNKALDFMEDRGLSVTTHKWQGKDLPKNTTFRELQNVGFQVPMAYAQKGDMVKDIKPNLPWADIHFLERVGGEPLNPGKSYKAWPYYRNNANDQFRENEIFTHTYMERFWPRYANDQQGGKPLQGIRYDYGDLMDLVRHLAHDPQSRQAYLPVWFPEDTGVVHGGRVPCTIGYHFILRNGYLHCHYMLRSCDLIRHFRDDIYLAMRLTQWVLDMVKITCTKELGIWNAVKLGMLSMNITSLHVFEQDVKQLKNHYHAG